MLYLIDYYFGQGLNPACQLTILLKKYFFLFSPKNIDQEGDQKLKINFARPNSLRLTYIATVPPVQFLLYPFMLHMHVDARARLGTPPYACTP